MDYGILIELVKSCTFIYDKTHKDFKNKSVRVKAWKTISRIMEFPSECDENVFLIKLFLFINLKEKTWRPHGLIFEIDMQPRNEKEAIIHQI